MSQQARVIASTLHAGFAETLTEARAMGGADLIATSPPYADARTYGADVSWTLTEYAALGDACFSALKPGGWLLLNVDAPVRTWRPGFGSERGLHPWRLLLDYADRVGFRVPDRLAFARAGMPGEYAGRFRNDFEPLLWFQRPGGIGYFDKTALDSPAKSGVFAGGGNAHRERDGTQRRRASSGEAAEAGVRRRGTLWEYGTCGNGHTGAPDIEAEGHPARWPFTLASDLVRCFAAPGALVVDPFCGAGTTGAASIAAGRRFLGGDAFARERDGAAWAVVAGQVMARRAPDGRVRVRGARVDVLSSLPAAP